MNDLQNRILELIHLAVNRLNPVLNRLVGHFIIAGIWYMTGTTCFAQGSFPFKVGAAQEVITPMDTAYIAGHSHDRIFKGIHDDIYVKAIVISNDQTSLVILTFDCIGLLYPQLLQIRALVRDRLPFLPSDHVVMSSTHTHSGPDVVGLWGPDVLQSGVDSIYMKNLIYKATLAIENAWNRRERATAEYGLSFHGEEWVYNISEPEELDRTVTVLRFLDGSGKNIATLTNFACHPTFLDGVNDRVSADYVGGYYKRMYELQGGENLFLQGSIGGWVQPEFEEKTASQAFRRGGELAETAMRALDNTEPLKGNDLDFQRRVFSLPVENPGFIQLSALGVLDRQFSDSVLTEIAYFQIGNAAFATHPGETVPALSHFTKKLMKNTGPRFVLGLGMDALGYILKPYFFDPRVDIPHSQYLCSVSLGINTQECISRILRQLISPDKNKSVKDE